MTVEELKTHLSTLPEQDRAELANFLLDSLDDPDIEFNPEFAAELDRRVAEIENGQAEGRPAEVVFAELRKKYS